MKGKAEMPDQRTRLDDLVKHAATVLKTKREVKDLQENLRMMEKQRLNPPVQSDSGETEPD